MDTALAAVKAAGDAALRHFRTGVRIEHKQDRSPVTVADREAEAAALDVIGKAFPDHAILGEETGLRPGEGQSRWIIDPIDGTRGFIRGGKAWGPLVALELGGRMVAGAMAIPAEGRCYWAAEGKGAYRDGERLHLTEVKDWSQATLSLGELQNLLAPPYREDVLELVGTCEAARCEGDLVGCAMLLDGRADAWLEAGVRIWDLAPLKVLVEEAGGRFTNFSGRNVVDEASSIASNGHVHEHLIETLNRKESL